MSTTLEGLQWEQEHGYHALENAAEKINVLQVKIKELETVVDFWKTLSEYWETHSEAVEQTLKENQEKVSKLSCTWKEDEMGAWETDCGELWQYNEGDPSDNNAIFCHHCGKRILAIKYQPEEK